MGVQFLKTDDGDELVVFSRRDYDMLLARAGDEAAEDRAAAHLVREAREARAQRDRDTIPEWLSVAVLAGEHPIRAARKFMGLTQAELAARAHIGQAHLSEVESGKKGLSGGALHAVAGVLAVDPDWLAD